MHVLTGEISLAAVKMHCSDSWRLARSILRRPRMLVLDEATNALDPAAEKAVLDAVFTAVEGATILMISHRTETIGLADHVIDLGTVG